MAGKLTAVGVSRLTERGRYADGGGLYLQISKWGTKSWIFRYMRGGVSRTMGLGDVDTFSLKEARERARAQRQLLADDIDPLAEKQKKKQAERLETAKTITFKGAAEAFIKAKKVEWKSEKHADQWAATLKTYAYPVIGDLPVAAVDTALMVKVLEPIWLTTTETASRLRGRIEAILAWATVSGFRSGDNPARWRNHLDKLLAAKAKIAKVEHQPAMPYAELPAFMAELRGNTFVSAKALQFTILCATRISETIEAKWDEIDLDARVWTIPGERMKAGKLHRVPLSDGAIALLKSLPREDGNPFVFVGGKTRRPLSNMAMLQLLRGMRPGLVVHGFRSTFRDWAAESTNFPREMAEAALAHALESKVEAAYQRGDLLEKRRRMMEAWAKYCAKPAASGEVVPLRQGGVA
jgi:integrase